jgi:hypothetical protein
VGTDPEARRKLPSLQASGEDIGRLCLELRPRFQLALLSWIRGEEGDAGLRQMYGVVERLERASSGGSPGVSLRR